MTNLEQNQVHDAMEDVQAPFSMANSQENSANFAFDAFETYKRDCLVEVKVVNRLLHPLPRYETDGAGAMDIRASVDHTIKPGERKLIKTGLSVEIPHGFAIEVIPRSGLALKQGITALNSPGLIDSDYRGEIGVILINHSDETVEIKYGDRISQMRVVPVYKISFKEVESLSETERGTGGFGSTGK